MSAKLQLSVSHNIQLSTASPVRQRTICLKTGKVTNRGCQSNNYRHLVNQSAKNFTTAKLITLCQIAIGSNVLQQTVGAPNCWKHGCVDNQRRLWYLQLRRNGFPIPHLCSAFRKVPLPLVSVLMIICWTNSRISVIMRCLKHSVNINTWRSYNNNKNKHKITKHEYHRSTKRVKLVELRLQIPRDRQNVMWMTRRIVSQQNYTVTYELRLITSKYT